jgi:ABC-type uncharacterized transport system ATPase subunit
MASVTYDHVTKKFNETTAINDLKNSQLESSELGGVLPKNGSEYPEN